MADYYTQFSASLIIKPKAKEWCNDFLGLPAPLDIDGLLTKWCKERSICPDEAEWWPNFDYGFVEGHPEELWIYSEDGGSVDQVCGFVQEYLKKFEPNKHWTMEWSNSCSKPRYDGFGGGAVFVTAKKIWSVTSSGWIQEMEAKWNKKSRKGKK